MKLPNDGSEGGGVVLLSVKTKRRDETVRVQFSHAFDRCDEF